MQTKPYFHPAGWLPIPLLLSVPGRAADRPVSGYTPTFLTGLVAAADEPDYFEGQDLAVIKRLVQKLGGEVTADGAVGAGACFAFALPLHPEPAGER